MLSSRNLLALTGCAAVLAATAICASLPGSPGAEHALPVAGAQPWTSTTAASTTAATATSGTRSWTDYATDDRGFVNSSARCAEGELAAAIGRTQRSLVVVCSDGSGGYEYLGERVTDGATLKVEAEAAEAGFVASTDGASYTVSPTDLTVISDGKVIYRDTWIDYYEPQLTETASSSTTSSSATITSTTPSAAITPTPSAVVAPSTPRSWG